MSARAGGEAVEPSNRFQGRVYSDGPDGPQVVKARAEKRMQRIDQLPEGVRLLVHEYGWMAVSSLLNAGVSKPHVIESIITAIRDRQSLTPVSDGLRARRREAVERAAGKAA
ncbi:MAG: hypothetical protein AB7P02_05235 [Alphaproteobacteria bacterium]